MVPDDALLTAARAARTLAYAPYSNFAVGAALLCDDGTIERGCNVENASYGLTVCAERNAVFGAVAAGRRAFQTLAVVGPPEALTVPCGACRQVLAEFAPGLRVLYTAHGGVRETTLALLLPQNFGL